MDFGRFISRVLAILVIAGLVSQPLVSPAVAKHRPVADMAGMSEMAGMSGMSADMPCCPDEHKNSGCQECPLAMCSLIVTQAEPSSNGIQVSFQIRKLSFALVDLIADGLIGDPPDHPPRILT
ncbi:hypothetical protein [Bradyrhizobium sp. WSM1253]|uniref:hypothetical protein n=1 Tax=Bradyrhizobium sp. WSM1253 TaxID=319003 RepID=UPI00025D3068|nr:hypothetical protein [Bradyrhizobium sp. WSM1253]EIG62844.1 hypothetical protein Bra1253DRAFT_07786 [Bradyrhizobium sp. WSM1253]